MKFDGENSSDYVPAKTFSKGKLHGALIRGRILWCELRRVRSHSYVHTCTPCMSTQTHTHTHTCHQNYRISALKRSRWLRPKRRRRLFLTPRGSILHAGKEAERTRKFRRIDMRETNTLSSIHEHAGGCAVSRGGRERERKSLRER